MNKAEILDLITADVDDVSRAANRLPSKQVPATLRAAAELLIASGAGVELEVRLRTLKLLRFVQAALAGIRAPIPPAAAERVRASAEVVLMRDASLPDVHRAAEDVLRVLRQATAYTAASATKIKAAS